MTFDNPVPPTVTIRVPGSQNFTPEQHQVIASLRNELEANGYTVTQPIRKTASVTLASIEIVGIYLSGKIAEKAVDGTISSLGSLVIDWLRKQFRTNKAPATEPPKTTTVILYGPDDKPLLRVEVPDDSDEDE
ncbi:hypothetical protein [Mycobacteroides abscessus]|uniref:hypothetical protein n=1 Tax=Mycobacteroides abscessus TaxID=36809 RepID=UPI0012FFDDC4|nr:hypothetical protein [Mycobacteroides abscessus]